MYWILAAIFIVIALAVPRLRPVGVVGLVMLAALLAWGVVHRLSAPEERAGRTKERERPTASASIPESIPLTEVELRDAKLTGGGAPFELRGSVVNRSKEKHLRSITVMVTRRDCYEGALDPSGCVIVWQDRHWISISVPAGESREFATSVWMHGSAPRLRGTPQDEFEVVAATGVPAGGA
ncbi:MAG TPA: hypothetical protein VF193_12210 [Steroidobacter sp.]